MKLGKHGLELIKHFESCLKPTGDGRFEAYPDPAHGWNVPTIGWGTIKFSNGRRVKKGDVITPAQAEDELFHETDEKGRGVSDLVTVELEQHQFDALVSFAYNLGLGNLKRSTLLRKLNAGDYEGAAGQFKRWNRANGKVLKGLTRRRLSEERLFRGNLDDFILHSI